MYSTNLKMAGRVDCVGMFEGNLAIIDFKSSAKMKEKSHGRTLVLTNDCICNHG